MSRKTRYIVSMGELKRKDNSLVFKNNKGNHYIPIENTREIYCLNETTINSKLLQFLGKSGITLHIFDYYGHYCGTYFPKRYLLSGNLLIKQAEKYQTSRIKIAKQFVKYIAINIHELLYHYYRHGNDNIKEYLDWLRKDVPKMIEKVSKINQLLAIEGEVWRKFYESFKYILPKDFIMNKRVKRPPDNPVNAMISFGNSIIYTKTITEIFNTHLEPSISFLHAPSEGRFSLALDISEVFKVIINFKTIFYLINKKKIQINKHFDNKFNYCLLNEEGRNIFVKELEIRLNETFMHTKLRRKVSYQTAIKLDCYKLIKCIMEDKDFKPFSLKEMI